MIFRTHHLMLSRYFQTSSYALPSDQGGDEIRRVASRVETATLKGNEADEADLKTLIWLRKAFAEEERLSGGSLNEHTQQTVKNWLSHQRDDAFLAKRCVGLED